MDAILNQYLDADFVSWLVSFVTLVGSGVVLAALAWAFSAGLGFVFRMYRQV